MAAQIGERRVIVAIEQGRLGLHPDSQAQRISRTRQPRSSSARIDAHVISDARLSSCEGTIFRASG